MVTIKEWELGSRTRAPAAVKADAPKVAPKKNVPKSLQEVNARLRKLGPYPMATGPYSAEDYDALTRRRLDWTRLHGELLEQKRLLSQRTDNDAITAKQTETLSSDDVRKNATRVKQSEAWRHKQLDPTQQQAEVELESVIRASIGGPAVTARYGRIGGGGDPFTMTSKMAKDWKAWRDRASIRGVNVNAVVACIAEPLTMADVEKRYAIPAGKGIINHKHGLDVWSELRGWIKPPTPAEPQSA
jgi:hypothetical protein